MSTSSGCVSKGVSERYWLTSVLSRQSCRWRSTMFCYMGWLVRRRTCFIAI